jgi:hypothetical protein
MILLILLYKLKVEYIRKIIQLLGTNATCYRGVVSILLVISGNEVNFLQP